MATPRPVEYSALNWVKSEIDETLKQARHALEAYVENPQDETQMRFCAAYLHQVHGTLRMIELTGAALLAEEMEGVSRGLLNNEIARKEDAYETLMRAILQLPDYLERVQGAQRDTPALVLPLLNNLRELRGVAQIAPSSLFSPSLTVSAPRAQAVSEMQLDIRMRARKLRTAYQRALVELHRDPRAAGALQKLAETLGELEQAAQLDDARRLWWVAGGLIEALASQGLEQDKGVKLLLGQIDREIKRLVDQGEQDFAAGVSADLVKELLYCVARAESAGPRVSELRRAFQLDALLPQEGTAEPGLGGFNQEVMRSVAAVLHEDLERIKEGLDVFARSEQRNVASLQPLTVNLRQVADTLNMLGLSALAGGMREQLTVIEGALQGKLTLDNEHLMRIAMALLGAGAAVEEACSHPQLLQPGAEPVAEAYPQVLNLAVREAKTDLARVKEAITAFAADTARPELLSGVPQWLAQVTGGLTMLQLERAAELLGACGHYIAQYFIAQKLVPDRPALETLADLISAIEYYLEGVAERREDTEAALGLAQASLRALPQPTAAPPPSLAAQTATAAEAVEPVPPPEEAKPQEVDSEIVGVFIEEAQEEIASIARQFPLWQAKPEDQDALRTVRRSFHTLKGSGRLVGARDLGEFAWALEDMLNRVLGGTIAASAQVFAVVEQACALLPQLLAQFQGGPLPAGDVAGVMQRAGLLSQGQTPAATPPLAAAPPVFSHEMEAVEPDGGGQEVIEAAGTASPASRAQAPVAEAASPAAMDPVLLEIFSAEASGHLQALEEFIVRCRSNATPDEPVPVKAGNPGRGETCRVTEPLVRTLHTLHGSASMADIKEIAKLSAALEQYLKQLNLNATPVSGAVLEVIEQGARRLQEMVKALSSGATLRDDEALIARINALCEESLPMPPAAPVQAEAAERAAPQETDRELLEIFLEEAREILEASETALQRWIREGGKELLAELQREMHTLKGGARLAGVNAIGDLTHSLESLMTAIVEERIPVPVNLPEMMQRTHDRLLHMLEQLHAGQPAQPAAELAADIEELLEQRADAVAVPPAGGEPAAEGAVGTETGTVLPFEAAADTAPTAQAMPLTSVEPEPEPALPGERRAGQRAQYEQVRVRADLVDSLVNLAAEVSIARSRIEQQVGAYKFNLGEMDRTVERLRDQLRRLEIETEAQIVSRRAEAAARGLEEFDPLEFDRYTHMQQLSRSLMESVNDITNLQVSLQGVTREAETLLLQQARVNTDLQEGLMRTRMVQFSVVLPRMRRVVRHTAQELGKRVELNVAGVEGEMDRTVLDRVVPSLEHMLRNAVDHGIESVSVRAAAGKPETGSITLEVSREGSEIVITVRDDGAGVDLNAVRRKAEQRGLLKAGTSVADQHVLQFILEAGFSTASEITQISGRGVGMDVVSNQVKQLGGTLQISSNPGQGTTFVIRLPFTLSVNRALLVQAGENLYALPLTSVQRVMRMTHEELETLYANSNPQYTLDGQIYQLLHLGATHGNALALLPGKGRHAPVLLARSGDDGVAMQVDSLLGSREIVVKSLGPQIGSVKDVAGATIMGDGRVVLILDIPALIRLRAGLAAPALEREQAGAELRTLASNLPLVLVVDDSITVRKVTTRLLERHEMRVLTAKDGVDALAVLQQQIPDVMLLDIEMPRMDGYELAAQVRNDARLRHIPMIMITSRSGEKHRERAIQFGVNRYLGKPYKEAELVENIRSLLPQNRTLH